MNTKSQRIPILIWNSFNAQYNFIHILIIQLLASAGSIFTHLGGHLEFQRWQPHQNQIYSYNYMACT